jgi:transposase InsO family protein
MRLIDELHLKRPFYGAGKIAVVLCRDRHKVGRKRVTRLMRLMGIETIYRKPNLSRRHPQHKIYPYLLRNLPITRFHQVWSCDITYIPMKQGFLYLVAVIDWHSRLVLSWRLSNTMDKSFCVDALQEALDTYGKAMVERGRWVSLRFLTESPRRWSSDTWSLLWNQCSMRTRMGIVPVGRRTMHWLWHGSDAGVMTGCSISTSKASSTTSIGSC